jgi:hypothetical protein
VDGVALGGIVGVKGVEVGEVSEVKKFVGKESSSGAVREFNLVVLLLVADGHGSDNPMGMGSFAVFQAGTFWLKDDNVTHGKECVRVRLGGWGEVLESEAAIIDQFRPVHADLPLCVQFVVSRGAEAVVFGTPKDHAVSLITAA